MAPRPRTADLRLGFFEKLSLVPILAAVYDSYLAYCKRFNVQPVTETLKDGTNAYWVGSKGAEKVWIFFHGGGYSVPAAPEHFILLHSLIHDLNNNTPGGSSSNSLAALVLHYDVAPFAAYPRQLAQAAQLLNHVLRSLRFAPGNVLVGGDSAGGNLTLALLSHILHPHPEVPRVDLDPEGEEDGGGGGDEGGGENRLRAAVLISPWVSFDTTTASYARNATRDMISAASVTRWATLFLGGRPTDPYNEPVDVPAGWWKGLDTKAVRDVLFLAGEYEVLLDGILNCVESVRNEWGRGGGEGQGEVACVVTEGEGHISCWVDTMWGFGKEELKMYTEMREWLRARV
ncbi:Alpha beta hydrolase fold protein [Lasiodiplodia theobromae]|uniref:Alpha beta hydrolase fold protein n=1 Tax=Lasiodiplodia theobromae TaxID=45133 RepID=UPI0015C2C487|nr:Alpha beta hydrolase fold protein [Lasiodiplodia theobromae]KAF4539802.1 Alpha beta hydrolase fold protein [Lasiodiplodia theobromae]